MERWTLPVRPRGQSWGLGWRWRWKWPLLAAGAVGIAAALRFAPTIAPSLPPAVQPLFAVLSATQAPASVVAIPYLGINYLAAGQNDPAALRGGLLVASVDTGSPAAAAGILPGDLVIAFNGAPLHRSDTLVEPLRAAKPGERVTLRVQRRGTVWDTEVQLGRPAGGG